MMIVWVLITSSIFTLLTVALNIWRIGRAQRKDIEQMQDAMHEWEVEYVPDPMSAGGVVRSGDLVCWCGARKEDK